MKISCTILSPNYGERTHKIDTITIHCMAGDLSVEQCGRLFANSSLQASSNYGIGSDGRIGLYVPESKRSWCTSSRSNDNRAVTIEVANCGGAPNWPVSEAAYTSLIELVADICKRNGIKKLLWQADKKLIGQIDKQNMTVHRWFEAKACPGEWLYQHHYEIAQKVNEILEEKNMTGEQIISLLSNKEAYELLKKAQQYAATLEIPSWATEELNEAKREGITDGTRPQAFVTRAEAAIMAKRTQK